MPFLTIVTRTHNRPNYLRENQESLAKQSSQDFEQVVIEDKIGIGIAATYKALKTQEAEGDYVWLFDDDNILWDTDFIAKAKSLAEQKPDVILCKAKMATVLVPDVWPPILGHIDAMNYLVTRELWYKHRRDFGERYEGDYDFIASVATSPSKGVLSDKGVTSEKPKVVWMDGIVGGTQRMWKRGVAPELAEGSLVRIKDGVSGPWGNYEGNEIVKITKKNSDVLESLLRGNLAEVIDPILVPRMSPEEIKARNRVLIFCPTAPRLEVETVDAIFTQETVKFYDVMFTRDNPFSVQWDDLYKNVQLNYEKMRQVVLSQGYQKVWVVESDIIPPKDALSKLLEVDAPIVSGVYAHRHGQGGPNLQHRHNGRDMGQSFEWDEIRKSQSKTVEISGGCMGCLLIDRSVLKDFTFTLSKRGAPDMPFMKYCCENKIKQMARLDVLCLHKKPSGEILDPRDFMNTNHVKDVSSYAHEQS